MCTVDDPTALITGVRGSFITVGPTDVRCRAEEGHEGRHWGLVNPFPGFVDERVEW